MASIILEVRKLYAEFVDRKAISDQSIFLQMAIYFSIEEVKKSPYPLCFGRSWNVKKHFMFSFPYTVDGRNI